jgi:prefoldin subunit 5
MSLAQLNRHCRLFNNIPRPDEQDKSETKSSIGEIVNYTNITEIIEKQYDETICALINLFNNEEIEELLFQGRDELFVLMSYHDNSTIINFIGQGYVMPEKVVSNAIQNGNLDIVKSIVYNQQKLPEHILNIAEAYEQKECVKFLQQIGYKSD